jgi:S1-C subfamily serine protease
MPGDDIEKVNGPGGAAIASLAGDVLVRLSRLDARPVFTKPAASPGDTVAVATPDAPTGDGVPGHGDEPVPSSAYRVVFGTSPDMGYQGEDGVRLSSVRDGTPAQRAGLAAGDVIVAFDGTPVRNLEDYAVLLFAHRPGDEITVTVRRGAETLDLTAILVGNDSDT